MALVISKIRHELQEIQANLADEILSGGAATYDQYARLVGKYKATSDAIEIIERVVHDDDNRGLGRMQKEE